MLGSPQLARDVLTRAPVPAVNLVHLTQVNIMLIMVVPHQITCASSKPSAPDPGKHHVNHGSA